MTDTEFATRINSSLDEIDFDDNPSNTDSMFTASKLVGVAVFGAFAALTCYYVYAHLDNEKRSALRDCVISVAKEQVSSLTAPSK